MLILLTGLPGTGKSTVAKMIVQKTGGMVINSDTLRKQHRKLAQELGVDFVTILITAPEHLIKERFESRSITSDPSEATFETYLDRKKYFESVEGKYLTINNAGSLEELRTQIQNLPW